MIFMRFPGGLAKVLTFSYDDGMVQDERLIRLLDAHGMKGTFNLNTDLFSQEEPPEGAPVDPHRRMTRRKALELFGSGVHEAAVHGSTHCSFTEVPGEQIVTEIMRDRLALEGMLGRQVRGMAYPFGTVDEHVVQAARACGITYSRTVRSTHGFDVPTDWLRLDPTCHHADPELMPLAHRFLAARKDFGCKLFYVWGHTFEFASEADWQVIERFCGCMAGKADIWYATNGEIVDYVEQFRRLRCSADGQSLYNPTCTVLWLEKDHELVSLAPGEERRFG